MRFFIRRPIDLHSAVCAVRELGEYQGVLRALQRGHHREWTCPRRNYWQWTPDGTPPPCATCEALEDLGYDPVPRPDPPKSQPGGAA